MNSLQALRYTLVQEVLNSYTLELAKSIVPENIDTSPMEGIFSNPHPSGNSNEALYISLNVLVLQTLLHPPQEILSLSVWGVSIDIFWNGTL